jgi:hypothetical protein
LFPSPEGVRPIEWDEPVVLSHLGLHFDTSADPDVVVGNLDVWNGGSQIANFAGLDARGPVLRRDFGPPLEIDGTLGLNLSIGIWFPDLIDPPAPPAPPIVLNSAYAFLTVQGI